MTEERVRWQVVDTDNEVHVEPTTGKTPHQRSQGCWCEPHVEQYAVPLVIHREEQ